MPIMLARAEARDASGAPLSAQSAALAEAPRHLAFDQARNQVRCTFRRIAGV